MKKYPLSLDGTPPRQRQGPRWRRFARPPAADCGDLFDGDGVVVAVDALPHVVVTVPSGHVGVLWKRFGGGTVLDPRELKDEGLHLIWPWNELFMYDLRLQSITETYNAISSDGVSLTASVNARFRLQRDGVAILHKAIGPNFLQLIAQPGIGSLTREVIAHYTAEQVYSTARQEIQDKIRQRTLEKASEKRMGPVALSDLFILYDTLLYGIELPPFVVNAINRKTEQYYISEEYAFRVEREKKKIRAQEDRGRGDTRFSADRQPRDFGLLSAMARHRRDAATCAVHESTNSKIVIIGSGRDGLPTIFGNRQEAPSRPPVQSPSERGARHEETTAPAWPSGNADLPLPPAESPPVGGSATPSDISPIERRLLSPLNSFRCRKLPFRPGRPDRAEAGNPCKIAVRSRRSPVADLQPRCRRAANAASAVSRSRRGADTGVGRRRSKIRTRSM